MAEKNAGQTHGDPVNFPQYLRYNAKRYAGRPAFRHKDYGIWQTWTWAEAHDEIRAYSMGLLEAGLKAGQKVAIIGQNRPKLYWTFCAVQAAGGIPVPVYSDSVAEEMSYVLEHAEVSAAVCQDQEQVDKVLSIKSDLKKLKHIFYDETRGLGDYDVKNLRSIEAVQAMGREALTAKGDDAWIAGINKLGGDDIAVMLYTSGTTGRPKGVMLSFSNLVRSAINANRFDDLDETDEIIAYLPLAWVGDHVFSYAQSYPSGYCVCCPESPETADDDRREIAPTYFFAPPRVFESLLTAITVRMEDAGGTKRKMFAYFMEHARKSGEAILNGESVGAWDRLKYA
ncbi:MAG: AMP-binding protein, partial [Pseudomonadota bacterium]